MSKWIKDLEGDWINLELFSLIGIRYYLDTSGDDVYRIMARSDFESLDKVSLRQFPSKEEAKAWLDNFMSEIQE